MQWNEKCFFSKETPSLKRFSQNRRLKRSSGFHRPEKSCSVDGTTSLEEVWKAEIFHPGRNYRCVDGVFSQKQLGKLPSFKRLVNIRCIGKKKVPKWAPSIRKFSWIRWYSFVTTASEGASRLSINPAPRPKLLRIRRMSELPLRHILILLRCRIILSKEKTLDTCEADM